MASNRLRLYIRQGSGFSFVNQEAADYVARWSSQPDDTLKGAIDTYFTDIKAIGLTKFDVLIWFDLATEQASKLNLVSSSYDATFDATVTHTPGTGAAGDGVNNAITIPFNPTTAVSPHYVQNLAHFGVHRNTSGTGSNGIAGYDDGGAGADLRFAPGNGTQALYRINTNTTATPAFSGATSGLLVVNRSGISTTEYYVNGAVGIAAGGGGSSGVPNGTIALGGGTGIAANTNSFRFVTIGSSLNSTEQAALDTANDAFIAARGL